MKFKEHILSYLLIPLVLLFVGSAYVRFMIIHDYNLSYEVSCDEFTESCFIGCDDEECTEEYYYKKITKYAPDLYQACDADVSLCDFAQTCDPTAEKCSVLICSPESETDVCESFDFDNSAKGDEFELISNTTI